MLLHYLVNALSASCTWNHWPSAPINTRLYSAERVTSKYPRFEPSRLQDLGYHALQSRVYQTKICSVVRGWTAVDRRLVYTNMELNLPHHLSYVAALPCKCTQRIMHVKPLTFCTNKHQTLFRQTCDIQISRIWTQFEQDQGYHAKSCRVRQKSVAWMNGGWSTSGMAF